MMDNKTLKTIMEKHEIPTKEVASIAIDFVSDLLEETKKFTENSVECAFIDGTTIKVRDLQKVIYPKQVYMTAKLRPTDDVVIDKDIIDNMSFGGYNFEIGGVNIPFDFEGHSCGFNKDEKGQYIYLYTAESGLCKNVDIDDSFDEYYKEIHVEKENITAQFLASASKINEFYFEILKDDKVYMNKLILEDVCFIDENGKEYHVDEKLMGTTLITSDAIY